MFKTDEMLEDFELTKMVTTSYYRMHDQEMEAEKIEKEYEDMRSKIFESEKSFLDRELYYVDRHIRNAYNKSTKKHTIIDRGDILC
ncbi:MAG: hypothetical protein K2M91_12710 [Lachnospiraceae bacterium]|nr:hypothetical protein [Lachnospiraceae bacterium]